MDRKGRSIMSRLHLAGIFVALSLVTACEKQPKQETTTTGAQQTATATTQATTPHVETTAQPQPGKPLVTFKDDLKTPESVLYDDAADVYLASNINGKATEADNNGYIMRLSPDGKV